MPTVTSPPVGRLAPSPTGGLHLGHARTFLLAWLAARTRGGNIVLRIEDIDAGRVRPGVDRAILDDLNWLGLDWDRGAIAQSTRLERYREAIALLRRLELVYPCTCTRAEIERVASAPHAGEYGPTYPGTCVGKTSKEADELSGRPFAWRFRVDAGEVAWQDLVLGPQSIDSALKGGDFIVAREPFLPSYQLAVIVDDLEMGVTQVIRGEDLVASTPKQLLLGRALGGNLPRYGHVPLVVGNDGRRLAKRDDAIKLATLRERGVDPRNLIGELARLSGLSTKLEPSRPVDWLERFDLDRIPRGVVVAPSFDEGSTQSSLP